MNATEQTHELARIIAQRCNVSPSFDQANTLRRAQITLHRWSEGECGDGNDYASWSIERDEATQIPYRVTHPHTGKTYRTRIADQERGALERVARVCGELGLFYFYQTDPRGCALYVSHEKITDRDYTNGVGCCV